MDEIEKLLKKYKSHLLAKAYLKALLHQVSDEEDQLMRITSAKRRSESILSRYEEQIFQTDSTGFEKEKDHFYKLVIQSNELNKRLELAKFEIGVLEEKIRGSAMLNDQLHELLRNYPPEQRLPDITHFDMILGFTQKIEERNGLKREVSEAFIKGEELLKEIGGVKGFLHKLKSQMMMYNGVFNSLIGLSLEKLEKFQGMTQEAMQQLEAYEKEIADIYEYLHIPNAPKFRDGNEFVDQYFEKLSTDRLLSLSWDDCSFYLRRISEKVHHTQAALNRNIQEVEEHVRSLEEKRGALIIDAV